MLIDAREVDGAQSFNAAVCIVGGGVAGITLALTLARQRIDVCLLEGGGLKSDPASDDLYRGENVGIPYAFDTGYRSRYLGGSSNCWGGWSRPLEPEDFSVRRWVPYSGWPLGHDELKPYYDRTHALLSLGPTRFDSEFWETSLTDPRVRRVRFASECVRDSFTQFSPPVRMGRMFRHELASSRHIRVILHANATNIATDDDARHVTRIEARTLCGRRFGVVADYCVLAAGGIENARLLLVSDRIRRAGLGNEHDMVGRFFMDHPRLQVGMVRFRAPFRDNKLYDIKHQDKSRIVFAHDTSVAAQFVLAPEIVAREQLLSARVWFRSIFVGENSAAVAALHRYTQTLRGAHANLRHGPDLMLMLRDPFRTLGYTLARTLPVRPLLRRISYEIVVEPDPNPDSRVALADACDRLGLRRARLDWQLGPLVQKTFVRTLAIVSEELRRAGVADSQLPVLFPQGEWPRGLQGTWHHMGTTRMHDSPRQGVVDRNCRVHAIENLYVAGSSVFPTAGANFPTMTLAALTLRLADHLVAKIRRPASELAPT